MGTILSKEELARIEKYAEKIKKSEGMSRIERDDLIDLLDKREAGEELPGMGIPLSEPS